jgi:DNA-binding MarR family transcriptional regulator
MNEVRAGSSATELRESMMAVTRQMRRHRPDHGLTLSQLEVLGEVSRAPRSRGAAPGGISTPAELAARLHVRVQSLTDSINELVSRGLVRRRPDEDDRRRQLIEITRAGIALLDDDRAERDATMRENLTDLEFNLLMLVAPVLRKLAYAGGKVGTLPV